MQKKFYTPPMICCHFATAFIPKDRWREGDGDRSRNSGELYLSATVNKHLFEEDPEDESWKVDAMKKLSKEPGAGIVITKDYCNLKNRTMKKPLLTATLSPGILSLMPESVQGSQGQQVTFLQNTL